MNYSALEARKIFFWRLGEIFPALPTTSTSELRLRAEKWPRLAQALVNCCCRPPSQLCLSKCSTTEAIT